MHAFVNLAGNRTSLLLSARGVSLQHAEHNVSLLFPHRRRLASTALSSRGVRPLGTSLQTPHNAVRMASSSPSSGEQSALGALPTFAQTMLRIRDPAASRKFYEQQLGMKFLTQLDFEDLKFSLLFFAYTHETPVDPSLPQADRAKWLWQRHYPTVELTHNWDSPDVYHNGNTEPKGYVGLSVLAHDAASACRRLKAAGVQVVSEEPRTSSFCVQDPDGYWLELVQNSASEPPVPSAGISSASAGHGLVGSDAMYARTTFRVKDSKKSIEFYKSLGMKYLGSLQDASGACSSHFLGYTDSPALIELNPDASEDELSAWLSSRRFWMLQLRSEQTAPEGGYHNGNTDPRGFGHIGITVSDIYKSTESLRELGAGIKREPGPFKDAGEIAFVLDPDGYWIELIQRGDPAYSTPYLHPPPS